MKRRMRVLTSAVLVTVFSASLAAAEYVRNGDFESGNVAPWRLSKPNAEVALAIVPDSGSPCGGSGALGITLPGVKRVDVAQRVKKIGPGTYKLTAYMDTTRCTKPGGYIMIFLEGNVNGKYSNFGCIATPGTGKDGWRKTEWRKFEKVITVPEGGAITSVTIALINNLTGTVMLDGISIQECAPGTQPDNAADEKKK